MSLGTKKKNEEGTETKFSFLSDVEDEQHGSVNVRRDGISRINFSAYAVGHVYNDFCATVWFMYVLYFLTYVVNLGAGRASICLLVGQLVDGVATNLIGILTDKFTTRIGKNKPWYIFGFLLVLPTFILIFNT